MAKLVNLNTNAIGDVEDDDLYEFLDSGDYDFADEETPIHVTDPQDPKGLGFANYMNKSDAKRYILQRAGKYMTTDDAYHWKNKKLYGDSEGAAAALGAAGALSFGIIPGVAGLVSDEAAGIMDANPGWMIGSDILTTIAALALAPQTGGASTLAGASAGGRLARLAGAPGLKQLIAAAKKAPWKHTAPVIAREFGKGVERKIGEKLLGQAAEEQLKKAGMRGLTARMGGMGAEALIYSAGYSLADAANEMKKGKSWDEVAISYGQDVGMGTLLGLAIPGVFHGGLMTAGKVAGIAKGISAMPVNWAFNSKVTKDAVKWVAKGHDDMQIDSMFGKKADQLDIEEMYESIVNQDGAVAQAKVFGAKLDSMVKKTVGYLKKATGHQELIKTELKKGHSKKTIKDSIKYIKPGQSGAASSVLLSEKLLNGNFAVKGTQVSRGFIPALRNEAKQLLQHGQRQYQDGVNIITDPRTGAPFEQEVWETLSAQGADEIKGIIKELDEIEAIVNKYVNRRIKPLADLQRMVQAGPRKTAAFKRYAQRHSAQNLNEWTDVQQRIGIHMVFPAFRKRIDLGFNTEVFHRLEKLSIRVHDAIPHGPIQPSPLTTPWQQSFKDQLTEFLTESGKTWAPVGSLSMFGRMAKYKLQMNKSLVARQGQHDILLGEFGVPLEKFPAVLRFEPQKIEGTLRTLHNSTSESKLTMLREYALRNVAVLKHLLDTNPDPASRGVLSTALAEALQYKNDITLHNQLMKTKMKKALQWSAVLQEEAKQAASMPNRSILPYLGTGTLATAAGYAVGGPVLGAAAGLGVTGARYGYQMASNPARTLAQLQKFFAATNAFDGFIDSQVSRYFTWLNRAGERVPGARLSYMGPGSDHSGRYSSILGSRFIAEYVREGE